jgi:hypothetical protein
LIMCSRQCEGNNKDTGSTIQSTAMQQISFRVKHKMQRQQSQRKMLKRYNSVGVTVSFALPKYPTDLRGRCHV